MAAASGRASILYTRPGAIKISGERDSRNPIEDETRREMHFFLDFRREQPYI
jgi:hypothetical protein